MKIPPPMDLIEHSSKGKTTRGNEKVEILNSNITSKNSEEITFPHYKRVSDYLLGTCIGEGSFAKVRVGFHCLTNEKVAIKIINKAKAKRDGYVYRNLHREGRLMQMLRHPNIVQVFDILETGNNYYLVTELCSGGELIDIVTEKGFLSEDTVCKYMSQLVNAVAYLHERKIVHRDLKVENLLLDSRDNVKIIDFGLSNVLPESYGDISCCLSTQCGSPAYAAPELLAKQSYGPKVDVWSIGVITFALLAGKLPFTTDPFNISKLCKKMIRGDMNPIPASASSQCRFFIRKLLTPDQVHRPSIYDVTRLKWVLAHQQAPRNEFSNTTVSSLIIDRFSGESGIRRKNGQMPSSSPIDSSIVKDMVAAHGFPCPEVVQCVQKNKPGPALATYYLLLRKKRRKETHVRQIHEFDRSRVEIKEAPSDLVGKENDSSNKASSNDAGSTPSSDNYTATPSLPKIRLPDPTDSIAQENKDGTSTKPWKDENQQKRERKASALDRLTPLGGGINPISNNDKSEKYPQQKDHIVPTIHIQGPTPLNPINHASDLCNNNEFTTPIKLNSREQKDNKAFSNVAVRKLEQPKIHKLTLRVKKSAQNSDSDELLESMRKARQVLERRHQLQNQNRLRLLKQLEDDESKDELLENKTALDILDSKRISDAAKPPTFPRKQGYFFKKKDIDPRSTSQQSTCVQEVAQPLQSPSSPTSRPASQNVVMSKAQDHSLARKRNGFTPASPPRPRRAHDRKYAIDTTREHLAKSSEKSAGKSFIPTVLPVLVPRTGSPKTSRREVRFSNGTVHFSHDPSLTTPSGHCRRNHSISVTSSPVHQVGSLNRGRRSVDISLSSNWKNPYTKEAGSDTMGPYGYHQKYNYEKSAPALHRPKKVISEPIAAAISYLTSTKSKAFRRGKASSTSAR